MSEQAPQPRDGASAKLSVVGAILAFLGTIGLAIWSMVREPPFYPGRFFVERISLWNNGSYGVKLTFAATWVSMMLGFGVFVVTMWAIVRIFRELYWRVAKPRDAFPPGPAWVRLPAEPRAKYLAIALFCAASSSVFYWLIVSAPEKMPVAFLGEVGLLVMPFGAFFGEMALWDIVFSPETIRGRVDDLQVTEAPAKSDAPQVRVSKGAATNLAQYWVVSGKNRWLVRRETFDLLKEGDAVCVRKSAFFDRIVDIAVERLGPYR